jgi:AcrR family transcriptional regulator
MSRSDAKRQAILDTAYRLFRTRGFDKTSVSEITTLVGGSKATIYSHFASKEELFVECMTAAAENYITSSVSLLGAPGTDPARALRDFGASFLSFSSSSHSVEMKRLLIAEANRSGIGTLFYAKTIGLRAHVAAFLSQLMASGVLRFDNAQLAAEHLRALLEAEIIEPLLLNVRDDSPDEEELALAANRAVAAFLRAYAPAGR